MKREENKVRVEGEGSRRELEKSERDKEVYRKQESGKDMSRKMG